MATQGMTQLEYICPNANCGYRGAMLVEPKGSFLLALVLLCLGILPGVIYIIFGVGHDIRCPNCRNRIESH